MAQRPKLKFLHSPIRTYPDLAQSNYVGAQATAGRRGTLPTFTDANSYFVSKSTGSDSNAGTEAAPFKTLGKVFQSDPAGILTDYSGNAYDLVQGGDGGAHVQPAAHLWPTPPVGDYVLLCDNYNASASRRYLAAPAGFLAAMTNQTTWSVEGWFCVDYNGGGTFSINSSHLWGNTDNMSTTGTALALDINNALHFTVNGTDLATANNIIDYNKWYYIAATFDSGVANGKKIYVGISPETAVLVASGTQTHTLPAWSAFTVGGVHLSSATGWMRSARVYVSSVVRSSFPTAKGASDVVAAWYFQTLPLAITAAKSYVVIDDSEDYAEGLSINYPWEGVSAIGVYAADGQTPTFGLTYGATAGTYGAGNAVQTKPIATADYFVAKTGSDGNAGTSGSPFLTIQKALTTMSSGQAVEVQDSGVYSEDLTFGTKALVYLQAASGQSPTLRNVNLASAGNHFTLGVAAGAQAVTIFGFIINEQGGLGKLVSNANTAASSVTFDSCTILNGTYLSNNGAQTTSLLNCSVLNTKLSVSDVLGQIRLSNSYYFLSTRTTVYSGMGSLYSNNASLQNSTLTNVDFNVNNTGTDAYQCGLQVTRNRLVSSSVDANIDKSATTGHPYGVLTDNMVTDGYLKVTTTFGIYVMTVLTARNYVQNGSTVGLQITATDTPAAGYGNRFALVNNVVTGAVTSYSLGANTGTKCVVRNCTSISATTVGWALDATVNAAGLASVGDLALSSGSPASITQAKACSVIDDTADLENATLLATDLGNAQGPLFLYSGVETDMGFDWPLFDGGPWALTVDGLTFQGEANMHGGITSSRGSVLTVNNCTFTGLGNFGVKAVDSTAVTNSLFTDLNGHGIKTSSVAASITNNAFDTCLGSGFLNYGIDAVFSHNTASDCAYGAYDKHPFSSGSSADNVLTSSGVFDYSGPSTLTYTCVGTLDTDDGRTPTLGTGCLRVDPLLRDPANGDLRLMAIAAESQFDSPCIGVGSSGSDMGAFTFTYGACELTFIEVNFETVSPSGKNYRNPDKLSRELVAVKLAENDRENGAFDSGASAYKLQFTCSWAEPNDMPLEQLIELMDMFRSETNELHACIDGGWLPARLVRGSGFSYEENSELGYTETDIPTPLRTLVFREE